MTHSEAAHAVLEYILTLPANMFAFFYRFFPFDLAPAERVRRAWA